MESVGWTWYLCCQRNCGAASVGVLQDNLVLLTGLIMRIGHRKEIRKLTFRALAIRSDEGLILPSSRQLRQVRDLNVVFLKFFLLASYLVLCKIEYGVISFLWLLRSWWNVPHLKISSFFHFSLAHQWRLIFFWIDNGDALVAQSWTLSFLKNPIEPH